MAAVVLASAAMLTPQLLDLVQGASRRSTPSKRVEERTAPAAGRASQDEEDDPLIDFFGNEVSNALARYRLDAAGAPYETHSPQTEVPRLRAPRG